MITTSWIIGKSSWHSAHTSTGRHYLLWL